MLKEIRPAIVFIVGLTMFGVIIFVPLYLQVVNGASPTRSGRVAAAS